MTTTRAAMVEAVRSCARNAKAKAEYSDDLGEYSGDEHAFAAALTAAAEALAAEAWRPIAECPEEWKDGRPVLLGHGVHSFEAYWRADEAAWYLANEDPDDYHAAPFYGAEYVRLMPAPPPPEAG